MPPRIPDPSSVGPLLDRAVGSKNQKRPVILCRISNLLRFYERMPLEIFLNVFREFAEFNDKKLITVKGLEPAT